MNLEQNVSEANDTGSYFWYGWNIDRYGKVKQPGKTYHSEKGEERTIKRRAKEEQKMKK